MRFRLRALMARDDVDDDMRACGAVCGGCSVLGCVLNELTPYASRAARVLARARARSMWKYVYDRTRVVARARCVGVRWKRRELGAWGGALF